jgi:hypothetical protein
MTRGLIPFWTWFQPGAPSSVCRCKKLRGLDADWGCLHGTVANLLWGEGINPSLTAASWWGAPLVLYVS